MMIIIFRLKHNFSKCPLHNLFMEIYRFMLVKHILILFALGQKSRP